MIIRTVSITAGLTGTQLYNKTFNKSLERFEKNEKNTSTLENALRIP